MSRLLVATLAVAAACAPPLALIRPGPDDRSMLERRLSESDAALVVEVVGPDTDLGTARGRVPCLVRATGLGAAPETLDVVYLRARNAPVVGVGSRWFVFLRSPRSAPLREAAGEDQAWRATEEGLGVRIAFGVLATGETEGRALDAARTEAALRRRFDADADAIAKGSRAVDGVRIMFRYADGAGGYTELGLNGRGEATAYRQPSTRPTATLKRATVTTAAVRDTVTALAQNAFAARQRESPAAAAKDAVMVVVDLGTGAQAVKLLPASELAQTGSLAALFELARQATTMPAPNTAD